MSGIAGYPEDLRLGHQRQKAAASHFGDFEFHAARVVARLTGEQVTMQDDNSEAGTADLRINYGDGRVAYGEVVIDVVQRYAETAEQITRRHFGIPTAVALTRDWHITLSNDCSLRRLDRALPMVLTQLECDGDRLFETLTPADRLRQIDSPSAARLLELGVVRVMSRPASPGEVGKVRIASEGMSGPAEIPWEQFFNDLIGILSSDSLQDVRNKLAAVDADECHVFLGVSFTTSWAINRALDPWQPALPPPPPALPAPITHLWLMPTPLCLRCIAWFPDKGWFDTSQHWATG